MKQNRTAIWPLIRSEDIFNTANVIVMLIIGVITLYPFWYCIALSLNEGIDAMRGPVYFWPRVWTMENYHFVVANPRTLNAAFVAVMRTLIGTLMHLVFTGIVAYGLRKRWIMGRKMYMLLFIFTMYFSGGLVPTYLLFRYIGLIDNFLIYVLPPMFSFFHAIWLMAFYESIPESLEEAAFIDGAGHFVIFTRIIVPTAMPIFATIALFSGVTQWNAWFDTLIFTRSDNLMTLQGIMNRMIRAAEAMQELNEQMAASGSAVDFQTIRPITIRVATMVFTTLPITIVYPFLQKYFVKGILLGSVKE